jgi:DNA-directed RNA polymerase specialized sigma24 family protein
MSIPQSSVSLDFVEDVVPHLNAAYNLARWLTRNDEDAQDLVQEAYMRAFRLLGGFEAVLSRFSHPSTLFMLGNPSLRIWLR